MTNNIWEYKITMKEFELLLTRRNLELWKKRQKWEQEKRPYTQYYYSLCTKIEELESILGVMHDRSYEIMKDTNFITTHGE